MQTEQTQTMSAEDRNMRLRFMRITPEKSIALKDFWPVVEQQLPEILNAFYAHVSQEPKLAQMLGNDIPRLKTAQGGHWAKLFSGTFDDDYFRSVRTIGFVHNKIGLEPRWYIGGYNFVLGMLSGLVARTYRFQPAKMRTVMDAVIAAVMLDMDIAISVYQDEMLADRQRRQDKIAAAITDFDTDLSAVLGTLNVAANDVSMSANSLAANAEETSRQCTAVAAASEESSSNVQTVAAATEQLSASVSEISRQVSDSTSIASAAVKQAEQSRQIMDGLDETASKIGDVIGLIANIASQTNLLALNATIEAARAGEAGKGFAVVATEVKSLASQTAKATEDISSQIAAIQTVTRQSVESISGIAHTIEQINVITSTVATAMQEQTLAISEITRNVQQASVGAQDVSQNITGVSQAAAETGNTSSVLMVAARDLSSQSEHLRDQVRSFFDRIAAA